MTEKIENLIGEEKLEKIKKANICVFGLGGVGGYAVEALVRSGIGSITIIDNDIVKESNLNRQIIANTKTIGQSKVSCFMDRIHEINPDCNVQPIEMFFTENSDFDVMPYDYIIDCIDTVSAKLELVCRAKKQGIPIISSMGTGNKLDPSKLCITDISKTSVCPLARVMRYELRKKGISHLDVLFSTEEPLKPNKIIEEHGRHAPASMIFVPACAGLKIAAYVIGSIIKDE